MKKLIIVIIFSSTSLYFISCKKYLEVPVYDSISNESPITDRVSAEAALRGVYHGLATLNYSSTFQQTILLSGKDARSVNNAQTDLNIINYNLRPDIPLLNTLWGNYYTTIDRANNIIEKVPSINDPALTNVLKDQFLGEAHFVRALSYFELARLFGNIPIYLNPTKNIEDKLGVKQSTQKEVFDQVISDLVIAEQKLPNTIIRNRARRLTAIALRSKVRLYQEKFDDAEADATSVLSNSQYKLITPYALARGTSESILEISFSVEVPNGAFNIWKTSNRQLQPTTEIHNLLNDATIGGARKILSTPISNGFEGQIFPNNTAPFYLIRTAEIILNRAEARIKKSVPDITGSLSDLNEVRTKRGLTAFNSANTDDILLAIERERRVEFALEHHRWFDLIRTKRAGLVLGATNPDKYIFPIPSPEIIANPSLIQNPGY